MLLHLAHLGNPNLDAPARAFAELAGRSPEAAARLTDDPAEASVILFTQAHMLPDDPRSSTFARHPLTRRFPERVVVYDERDRPWGRFPGIYTSMPRPHWDSTRFRAWSYYACPRDAQTRRSLSTATRPMKYPRERQETPKTISGPRIVFEQGDQSDLTFLRRIVAQYGPFDLVIDDGSHVGRHISASYSVLWEAVRSGGHYIVEDLSVSYHSSWEGGPPGTPGTGVAVLKNLLDDTVERYGQEFHPSIAAMHIYADTAVLRKA